MISQTLSSMITQFKLLWTSARLLCSVYFIHRNSIKQDEKHNRMCMFQTCDCLAEIHFFPIYRNHVWSGFRGNIVCLWICHRSSRNLLHDKICLPVTFNRWLTVRYYFALFPITVTQHTWYMSFCHPPHFLSLILPESVLGLSFIKMDPLRCSLYICYTYSLWG